MSATLAEIRGAVIRKVGVDLGRIDFTTTREIFGQLPIYSQDEKVKHMQLKVALPLRSTYVASMFRMICIPLVLFATATESFGETRIDPANLPQAFSCVGTSASAPTHIQGTARGTTGPAQDVVYNVNLTYNEASLTTIRDRHFLLGPISVDNGSVQFRIDSLAGNTLSLVNTTGRRTTTLEVRFDTQEPSALTDTTIHFGDTLMCQMEG